MSKRIMVKQLVPNTEATQMPALDESHVKKLYLIGLLVWLVLSIMTSISLYIIYGPLTYERWPAARFSWAMAALTCLWSYALWFFRLVSQSERNSSCMFAVAFVPLDFLIVYPGLDTLGLESDKDAFKLIIALMIIHGFGNYSIQQRIKKYLKSSSDND